jgi:hypothetical protein
VCVCVCARFTCLPRSDLSVPLSRLHITAICAPALESQYTIKKNDARMNAMSNKDADSLIIAT